MEYGTYPVIYGIRDWCLSLSLDVPNVFPYVTLKLPIIEQLIYLRSPNFNRQFTLCTSRQCDCEEFLTAWLTG
jgi:hypothetical protein